MTHTALENAVYILAGHLFHDYTGASPNDVHPYSLMARALYVKKTPVPPKPILIGRTSTSIMLKLPFYRPITDYKAWREINSLALFGKPSGSGVAVSLNNTEYKGTGVKVQPGAVLTITGLTPNEKYVFAAGGYTRDGVCVNGIGETSDEITTLLPLSLPILYGYLSTTAFKLRHF